MHDKFDYYDVLGHVIPGLVLVGGAGLLLYWFGTEIKMPTVPNAVAAIIILGIGVFAGNIMQALSSLLEPFYFWSWGGMPSNKLLAGQSRRLSGNYIALLRDIIQRKIESDRRQDNKLGENNESIVNDLDDRDVFMHCLTICNQKSLGRVNRFNSLYAYHRALTTLSLLFLIVTVIALIRISVPAGAFWVVTGEIAVTLILWNRTRQRGYYFAEEVLRTSACEIISPAAKKEEKQQA